METNIKNFSCSDIYTVSTTLFNLANNVPALFSDFCFNWYFNYLYGNDRKLFLDILKIRNDESMHFTFTQFDKIINDIPDFDTLFDLIYHYDDETKKLAAQVSKFYNSNSAKYLFIIRNIIDKDK